MSEVAFIYRLSPTCIFPPSLNSRALKLAQNLEELKAELASIMGDSNSDSLTTKPVKRGRPAGKRGMSEEGRKRIAEAQKETLGREEKGRRKEVIRSQ